MLVCRLGYITRLSCASSIVSPASPASCLRTRTVHTLATSHLALLPHSAQLQLQLQLQIPSIAHEHASQPSCPIPSPFIYRCPACLD